MKDKVAATKMYQR